MIAQCRAQDRRVIAGGPDPVQYLTEYLDAGVEVVVIGEGEQTTQALIEHLRDHQWAWDYSTLADIDGIAYRPPGTDEITRTAPRALLRPIDRFPWPARERRDLDSYFEAWRDRHGETALSMISSRGCPYHCTWCSKQVYGDTFRRRDVDEVIDELVALKAEYAPDQIWFADDMFTINRRWVHRFCQRMVERDAVTPFYIIGRPETLDPSLCAALREAGCYRVYLSAESGAQHVLDAMRKESTVGDVLEAERLLRAAGIELGVFVMLGYPGETWKDVNATLQMLHTINPDVTLLSVAHPMKGTAFFDQVEDRIQHPVSQEQTNGGRLAFRMDQSATFYDLAQRMIWAETRLVRKLRRREYDTDLLRLAVKAPLLRAGAWAAQTPLGDSWTRQNEAPPA
jgi:radical SAM superfamily enzyme YgiQ (UPF0313 family)